MKTVHEPSQAKSSELNFLNRQIRTPTPTPAKTYYSDFLCILLRKSGPLTEKLKDGHTNIGDAPEQFKSRYV